VLIRDAELGGRRVDCRLAGDRIAEIAEGLARRPGEPVHEAAGGALLPGLHDHHLHLAALAAARASIRCGPPEVRDEAGLAATLAAAAPGADGWIRGVGYHEHVAGWPDRHRLDAWRSDQPVRVQHRGGAWWLLNGAALARLGLAGPLPGDLPPGVERDPRGRATGRVHRSDVWLRERGLPPTPIDLPGAADALAARGVAGFTEATPHNGLAELECLRGLRREGRLGPLVRLMGGAELDRADATADGVEVGEHKILLDEIDLPALPRLAARIGVAHAARRAVAIHCVTAAELALAVGALEEAGVRAGDRLEHASVTPDGWLAVLARLGLTVVTQPGFVHERGDDYARDVEPREQPWLYRGASFEREGVALGGGTDAPFGEPDPWRAMQAAVTRRTRAGRRLGPSEALSPERALALFTTAPARPGGPARRVAAGGDASLCLLDRPWSAAREGLAEVRVRATWAAGRRIWCG